MNLAAVIVEEKGPLRLNRWGKAVARGLVAGNKVAKVAEVNSAWVASHPLHKQRVVLVNFAYDDVVGLAADVADAAEQMWLMLLSRCD